MVYIRVSGGINVASTTATASDTLSTKKIVLADGTPVDGTITPISETTYTPSTTNQVIPSHSYLAGNQIIQPDANFVASNIRSGKTIFGINGSLVDMTDNAYWWNEGPVAGKPYQDGYLWKDSDGWKKKTNSTKILVVNEKVSGLTNAFSQYTFYTGPYKGFEITYSNGYTQGTYFTVTLVDANYNDVKKFSSVEVPASMTSRATSQFVDANLVSQWCYLKMSISRNTEKSIMLDVYKIRPILR